MRVDIMTVEKRWKEGVISRVDIMTDSETLGNKADSTIIQISAIAFDIKTGNRVAEFNQIADITQNERPLQVTGSTIKWWLNTNKELLTELINSGEQSPEKTLEHFHEWLVDLVQSNDSNEVYLLGNGILFDNKMIQHQFEALGLEYPIFFRNDRDLRTLVDLTCVKLGVSEKELKAKYADASLVAHNAYDDVVYQINLAVACFKELAKG